MTRRNRLFFFLFSIFFLFQDARHAFAMDMDIDLDIYSGFEKLNNPALHCGYTQSLNLFNKVNSTSPEIQKTDSEVQIHQQKDRELKLLIHFEEGKNSIPKDCLPKLNALNKSTKSGLNGRILIRSTTQIEGSTELNLALASQRLDELQRYLRANRLARRAFVLELHPEASSTLFEETMIQPNVVEIYSSPTN
jgi:hypothetical protein